MQLKGCSWLVQDSKKTFCLYPPKSQTKLIRQWSEESQDPNSKWEKSRVEVIKYACGFAQGERRISRYETTLYVQSSSEYGDLEDSENESEEPHKKRSRYNSLKSVPNSTEDALDDIPSFDDAQDNTSNTPSTNKEDTDNESSHLPVHSTSKNNNGTKNLEILLHEQKKCIIESMEKIIKKEIKKATNSMLYSVRKRYDEIKAKMTTRSLTGQSEMDLQKELGFDKSFDSYEAFIAFDNRLQDDDLNVIMKDYISIIKRGSKNTSDAIKRILPRLMAKAVQLKYSGCGRQSGDKKKESFAETNTYKIMKDTLKQLFPNICEKEILTRTSRWFSGAPDRDGGRKDRLKTVTQT
ncbi:uncharacterized protein [Temnothorax longispinosus]|uniref:uncharacterized protein isoform X2 n=1 Tax=Temnothorax longispinosus TaxID=300112 RepID=UPI003A98D16B